MRVSGLSSPSTAWCELPSVRECRCCSSVFIAVLARLLFLTLLGETEITANTINEVEVPKFHPLKTMSSTGALSGTPCFLPGCLQEHMCCPLSWGYSRTVLFPCECHSRFLMPQLTLVISCFSGKFASQLQKCQTTFQSLVTWTFSCYCFFFTFLPVIEHTPENTASFFKCLLLISIFANHKIRFVDSCIAES